VRNAAQKLKRVPLLLQRVVLPTAVAHQLHLRRLDLILLALGRTFDQRALDGEGGARGQLLHLAVGGDGTFGHDLDALWQRTVVELNEREGLLLSHRPTPSLDDHLFAHKFVPTSHDLMHLEAARG